MGFFSFGWWGARGWEAHRCCVVGIILRRAGGDGWCRARFGSAVDSIALQRDIEIRIKGVRLYVRLASFSRHGQHAFNRSLFEATGFTYAIQSYITSHPSFEIVIPLNRYRSKPPLSSAPQRDRRTQQPS